MHRFTAWLWSIKKDKDGEVSVVLKVPQTEVGSLMDLPVETNLFVTIEPDEKTIKEAE